MNVLLSGLVGMYIGGVWVLLLDLHCSGVSVTWRNFAGTAVWPVGAIGETYFIVKPKAVSIYVNAASVVVWIGSVINKLRGKNNANNT